MIFFLIIQFSTTHYTIAQKGKDGPNVINLNGVIYNRYTNLAISAISGGTSIVITNVNDLDGAAIPGPQNNPYGESALANCDLLMIIKCQGAGMSSFNINSYGTIFSYNGVGDYELIETGSINGNTITLANQCQLVNNYIVSNTQRVQVVRIPRFTNLTINAGASLTSRPWGQVANNGGIVAIETSGTVIINGTVSATGQGFRGGSAVTNSSLSSVFNFVSPFGNNGGEKGESVVGNQSDYDLLGGRYARGAPANGGGGGNSNNSGGGGGSNAGLLLGYTGNGIPNNAIPAWTNCWNLESPGFAGSSSPGGGRGGYSQSTANGDATAQGPGNVAWLGDNRNNIGGYGGKPLDFAGNSKLFMGGGGGAGHSDDGFSQNAANGGGIIYFTSDGGITGSGIIEANGDNGLPTISPFTDGAGGGGGGGSVILYSGASISGITVNANGGTGGNHPATAAETNGPGGGGGGGYILTTTTGVSRNVNGGTNGTTTSPSLSEFIPNGATQGANGTIINNVVYPNNSAKVNLALSISGNSPPICLGGLKTYTVVISNMSCNAASNVSVNIPTPSGVNFTLTNPSSGTFISPLWTIPSLNPFGSATLTISGIITLTNISAFSGTATSQSMECAIANNTAAASSATVIEVLLGAEATPSVICIGNTAVLTATGANTYTWQPGNLLGPVQTVTPGATIVYTVSGNIQVCSASKTVMVVVNPLPTLTAVSGPTLICAGGTGTVSASGALSYTWFPGGLVGPTHTVTPFGTTIYTVIGTNAFGCTNSVVTVLSVFIPTITAFPSIVCLGQSSTLTAFGGVSYTWTPGNIVSPTVAITPSVSTCFNVAGTHISGCVGFTNVCVSVVPNPTITAIASPTGICPGSVSTLTAFGASGYYWLPPLNIADFTVTVSPSVTTIYTVVGYNIAGCTDTTTVQVTVYPVPTITAVANPSAICRGSTSTLSAGGASTYVWFPTGQSGSTIVVSPSVTTLYTVVGTNSFGCSNFTTVLVLVGPDISVVANPSVLCDGQSSTLTALGGVTYTWSPGGQNGSTLVVSPPVGNAIYTVSGTDAIGCVGTATVEIIVHPNPTITAGATPSVICSGAPVTFTASGGTTYNWSPLVLGGSSVTAFILSGGIYTVTGYNIFGCSDSKTLEIIVNNCTLTIPVGLSKKASEPLILPGEDYAVDFKFTVKNFATFNIYNIQVFDTLDKVFPLPSTYTLISPPICLANILTPNPNFSGNGNNTELLISSTSSLLPGQSDTISLRIKFSPNGIESYTNSAIAYATSQPTGGFSGTDISTNGDDPDPDGDGNPQEINESIPTVFQVLIDFFIPQGFSPNADNVNDLFVIRGIQFYPDNEFIVLNRWGNKVYSKISYDNSWDGKTVEGILLGGNDLPEGTYYYILHLKKVNKTFKGFLYLNRGLTK
ncbi:MAG: gliding motility-associated C-terminal domain-containing protein [Sphingobacteriaceae bacterium]|nr:gliding motility-associated C-terminal domain-containing protein [Sphingobacteriaceae bacterium]